MVLLQSLEYSHVCRHVKTVNDIKCHSGTLCKSYMVLQQSLEYSHVCRHVKTVNDIKCHSGTLYKSYMVLLQSIGHSLMYEGNKPYIDTYIDR